MLIFETVAGDNKTKVCGIDKKMCAWTALKEMTAKEVFNDHQKKNDRCNCLPTCTSIQYNYEILHSYSNPIEILPKRVKYDFQFYFIFLFHLHFLDSKI